MRRVLPALVLALATACAQGPSTGCSNVQIDWVDFIQVGSTRYVAGLEPQQTAQESDLGQVVAHVKFKVADNVCDPNYRPKDGDAAFLAPGTPIYQIADHPTTAMLAAHRDGRIVVYEAKAP